MRAWTEWRNVDGPTLRLVAGEAGLRAIKFMDELHGVLDSKRDSRVDLTSDSTGDSRFRDDSDPLLVEAASQLRAYFAGSLREFRLPLEMDGTEFQLRVWKLLCEIPYGETRSYRDLARALGEPQAVRAVGAANGANPLPIVVPCHRVIGANGSLTGYGGGLALKKQLLELERGAGRGLLGEASSIRV
jgi:methylated-DNA-[protein]-cysteine S-methyltransferase